MAAGGENSLCSHSSSCRAQITDLDTVLQKPQEWLARPGNNCRLLVRVTSPYPEYVPGWAARLFVTFSGRLPGLRLLGSSRLIVQVSDWLALMPGPAVALHSAQAGALLFLWHIRAESVLPAMCISHPEMILSLVFAYCRDQCLSAGEYFMRSFLTCCFRAAPLRYITAFLWFPALRERRCCLGGDISPRIPITFVSGKGDNHTYYKYSRSLLKYFFIEVIVDIEVSFLDSCQWVLGITQKDFVMSWATYRLLLRIGGSSDGMRLRGNPEMTRALEIVSRIAVRGRACQVRLLALLGKRI